MPPHAFYVRFSSVPLFSGGEAPDAEGGYRFSSYIRDGGVGVVVAAATGVAFAAVTSARGVSPRPTRSDHPPPPLRAAYKREGGVGVESTSPLCRRP